MLSLFLKTRPSVVQRASLNFASYIWCCNNMSSSSSFSTRTNHLERTATEPREKVRIFRLEIPQEEIPIRFLAGQWLDVFIPGIPKAGGFTITSSPSQAASASSHGYPPGFKASPSVSPYIELAIQKSPANRHAAWLWQDQEDILGRELKVRVGGSFVLPPPQSSIDASSLASTRRVVFVAGGVGVNPLMSMMRFLAEKSDGSVNETQEKEGASLGNLEVCFIYSMKDPGASGGIDRNGDTMLFLKELRDIFASGRVKGQLQLHLTQSEVTKQDDEADARRVIFSDGTPLEYKERRITITDVTEAVGREDGRDECLVYICGVPAMTDEFVDRLTNSSGFGMDSRRVLREKWW